VVLWFVCNLITWTRILFRILSSQITILLFVSFYFSSLEAPRSWHTGRVLIFKLHHSKEVIVMRKCIVLSLMTLGLVFGLASLAAANIPINLVDGDWQTAIPPVTIVNSGSSGGLSTARWGTPAGSGGQSGYDFDSRTTPFDVIADGNPFQIGTFKHINMPITGTSLTSIQLLLTLGIDGLASIAGTFNFSHDETPNSAPCAYPGSPACPDRVTIVDPILNLGFSYDDGSGTKNYFFNLLGFSQDNGVTIDSNYITMEDATNTSKLYGVITTTQISVPEPFTLLLLGLGLIGLAGFRKRS
jgi:hypothetical protein